MAIVIITTENNGLFDALEHAKEEGITNIYVGDKNFSIGELVDVLTFRGLIDIGKR